MILFAAAMILSSCSVGLYTDGVRTSTVASLNISMQPSWGPAGYNYAPYYYFPEFDFYYDVNKAIFYYLNHGRWIAAKHLPPHYPKDLHRYYKVVLTQHNPWLHNNSHRTMYKKYKGVYNQPVIGDKHKPHGPATPKPQTPQRPPQNNRYDHNKAPQNNGHNGGGSYYGSRNNQSGNGNYDNRNTVRDSRNNNTNRGTAYNNGSNSSQRGNGSNAGYNKPTSQGQQNNVAPSNNRGSNNSRSQQSRASSASSNSDKKSSSSSAQRGSSNSQGNRATGSRGR